MRSETLPYFDLKRADRHACQLMPASPFAAPAHWAAGGGHLHRQRPRSTGRWPACRGGDHRWIRPMVSTPPPGC